MELNSGLETVRRVVGARFLGSGFALTGTSFVLGGLGASTEPFVSVFEDRERFDGGGSVASGDAGRFAGLLRERAGGFGAAFLAAGLVSALTEAARAERLGGISGGLWIRKVESETSIGEAYWLE